MKSGLIVLSGGMDSAVLLHDRFRDLSLATSFDYGSKHNRKELACARDLCSSLGLEHLIIPLPFISIFFKSSLLSGGDKIPEGHYEDESMRSTVVPYRNGIMLSVACGLAESRELRTVYIANHAGDHAIYPDCRATFIRAQREAMSYGTYRQITLEAPYTSKSKREIGLLGRDLGVDFSKTWSCYVGGEHHCGKCGTCTERKEALEGFDPTQYL